MTDSIAELLGKRDYEEPDEVRIIKQFVRQHFNTSCRVEVRTNTIVISVSGASLAGALRIQLHELQELTGTNKRLMISIR